MLTMLIFFVPRSIRNVYFAFKDCFDELQFNCPTACSFFLLFLFAQSSLCDFVRICGRCPSVSALNRAAFKFKPNRFMRRNQTRILKKLEARDHGDFCFAVDDTANPKYGPTVFASASFGSSSGLYFGQKVLVLVVVDLRSHEAFPISYAFLSSKKDPHHVPAHERAQDLLASAIAEGFPPMPVAADSWFDSKEFIKAVNDLGCEFAGELKGNRLARTKAESGAPRSKLGQWFKNLMRQRLTQTRFQKRREKRGKAFSEKTLFINGLDLPLKIIAVYNRINGVTPFAFYATTDSSMSGAKLWRMSRARWAIEVMFRDLKQSLGFGRLTAGGEGGAHMAVCLPLILLTSIRLEADETWESQARETLGTIVKHQREGALTKSIETMIHNPGTARLERLQARRKNPNRKPTNKCGEKTVA